jgi:hypothetical protein
VGSERSYLVRAIVLVVAAYYGWWVFLSGDVFFRHSANAGNRDAVLRVHSALPIGADYGAVLKHYWSHRTQNLRLYVDTADLWVISMPSEFGASDWTLIVRFRDGKVTAVRVRTSDGPRPTDGPPDKGPPDA